MTMMIIVELLSLFTAEMQKLQCGNSVTLKRTCFGKLILMFGFKMYYSSHTHLYV